MSKLLLETPDIRIGADEQTGHIVSFSLYGRELLNGAAAGGSDLAVNGRPLALRPAPPLWINAAIYPQCAIGDALNEMHGTHFLTHYTGYALDVTRSMRAARHNEVHLSYSVQRAKIRELYESPGPGWGALEAPLRADSFTVPCWNWKLWGEDTNMVALNTGNGGPACHLGYENGPVEDVKGTVNHFFRRQYCGDMGFPGAVFYDRESENWLSISCRRPRLAYQLQHEAAAQGVAFEFLPLCEMAIPDRILLPEIAFHCGQTREEMQRFLAGFISTFYEEPPQWFFHTTWFDLSLGREYFDDWKQAEDSAIQLVENGAVSGMQFFAHRRHISFGGTSPLSAAPLDELGNRCGFEKLVAALKARGTRLLCWMSTCGMTQGGDADPDWFIRGADGDTLCAWGLPHMPHIVYINLLHPGFRDYTRRWLEYYLGELRFDGVVFDCAGFAYPPDFAPRDWMRFPSDTLLGSVLFFDWVREVVHGINPEAVVIGEGGCLDAFSNGMLLGGNVPSQADEMGQRDFLMSLRHHGGARFALRSNNEGDLGAGMVAVQPHGNFAISPDEPGILPGQYETISNDPYNILLTQLVRERGAYDAIALQGGASLLGNVLFVPQPRRENIPTAAFVPVARGDKDVDGLRLSLPAIFESARSLKNLLTGATQPVVDGACFFSERGIWEIE